MRVVAGRPATLRWHLTDESGNAVAPDAGVTVTITSGDGVTVLYDDQVATALGGHVFSWVLPPQPKLDTLDALWEATVGGMSVSQHVALDLISERLIEPWQLRANPDLASTVSDETLLMLLDQAEQLIGEVIGYPPTLEGVRVSWDSLRGAMNDSTFVSGTLNGLPYGGGGGMMLIPSVKFPRIVYGGSINGQTLDLTSDVGNLSVSDGALLWADFRPWLSGRYSLWLAHGATNPPRDLRWACGKLVTHFSKSVDYPDRASQVQTENATILFSSPSPNRPTGIPEVDAVLSRYALANVI